MIFGDKCTIYLAAMLGISLLSSCTNPIELPPLEDTFMDARDNKTYKRINIGEQVWMAKNLNYDASGSKCYDNDPANCEKYGRLYNWETAMEACPQGWHLPSDADWDKLYRYADKTSETSSPYQSPLAGKYLKATTGSSSGGNGTNDFGFAALPGGSGDSSGFKSIGNYGSWWSAFESNVRNAHGRGIYYRNDIAYWYDNKSKFDLFSVRCIQY
jgi:uncharacterized protein (TIGR02145 family)